MRGTPSVTAASLRAFSGRRTNAAERSTTKIVHFLRHGQAEHNPRAEAARDAGASFDEFLQLMKEDDAFDAALTPLGERQAEDWSLACRLAIPRLNIPLQVTYIFVLFDLRRWVFLLKDVVRI